METAARRKITPDLITEIASTRKDLEDSFKLRYHVFSKTFGSNFNGSSTDMDLFDAHCKHLIVRDSNTGKAIATTRLLGDEEAGLIGHFYSQGEFSLPGLTRLPGRILEIGRTCIHEDYRDGSAIFTLWQGLARFLKENNYRFLIGCASISMDDGGIQTEAIMRQIRDRYIDTSMLRAVPITSVPSIDLPDNVLAQMPALLKTYLRLGARACGEPCWDKEFGCADVFILLDMDNLCPRYARRFHLDSAHS